jgi:hypothetical protein
MRCTVEDRTYKKIAGLESFRLDASEEDIATEYGKFVTPMADGFSDSYNRNRCAVIRYYFQTILFLDTSDFYFFLSSFILL